MQFFKVVHASREWTQKIFDIIFPKRDDSLFLESLYFKKWQSLAKPAERDGIFHIFPYESKYIRGAIWQIKYRRNENLRKKLCDIASFYILPELSDKEVLENFTNPIIGAIPQSRSRKNERGFNQSEDIAKDLSEILHLPFYKFLYKCKDTPSQTTLSRNDRLKNMKGAFAILNAQNITSKNIILIDDVTTTGATLHEARKILLASGAKKVWCIALAH